MIKNKYILIVVLAVMCGSCQITKKYERPDPALAEMYRGKESTDTTTIADMPWNELFTDPNLQKLIQKGIDNNLDMKVAVARMNAASANLKQTKAAFFPSLSANASYTRSKTSSAQLRSFSNSNANTTIPTIEQYALTGSSSWELDVWGKLRSNKRAYLAAFLKSEAYRRTVQTQLIADIANNYYSLLAYDEQLRITERTIAIRKNDIETVEALKESGSLTGADLAQSKANYYAAEVTLPELKRSIKEIENTLSVLLGESPDSIPRSSLDDQTPLTNLYTGVPAQLLANRPDVIQAEYGLRNAFELTNVARTYFYPSLSLTAQGGWATVNSVSGFFDGTFYGSLVGGLAQPIFNNGLNKQRLRVAKANQEEAFFTFKNTLLTASAEVSNSLYSYQAASDKLVFRTQQLESLETAVDHTKELLRFTSNVNYTDVLTAETNLLTAQLNGINDRMQQLQAVVELYRALGGGWKN